MSHPERQRIGKTSKLGPLLKGQEGLLFCAVKLERTTPRDSLVYLCTHFLTFPGRWVSALSHRGRT